MTIEATVTLRSDDVAGVGRDRIRLLQTVAREGGGRYFELGRETDRTIASAIIDSARRHAGRGALEESFDELYWYCLAAAIGRLM